MDKNEKNIVICCDKMLQAISRRDFFLDSIHGLHLEDAYVGPLIERCPWCGSKRPVDAYKDTAS